MTQVEVMNLRKTHNFIYYFTGLFFLFLSKLKNLMQGYRSPRPFGILDFKKAIEYDFRVVDGWLHFLKEYSGDDSLKGKTILELGPGADLGVGIITLMKGAEKYNAIDVNDLVKFVPDEFYRELFGYIDKINGIKPDIDFLRTQLELARGGKTGKLNYLCRSDFDISVFSGEQIDLVLSQAAFEHFDDIEKTIMQLSAVAKPGTMLIAEIDLKTHSRWIRDADPLNIYRYPDFIYNIFKFRSSPNRVRQFEYEKILKKFKWVNIKIFPIIVLDNKYLLAVRDFLSKRFRGGDSRMEELTVVLCATKE